MKVGKKKIFTVQEEGDELALVKSVELAGIGQPARWKMDN